VVAIEVLGIVDLIAACRAEIDCLLRRTVRGGNVVDAQTLCRAAEFADAAAAFNQCLFDAHIKPLQMENRIIA